MQPYSQISADLVTFAEEIFNGKLHVLRSLETIACSTCVISI